MKKKKLIKGFNLMSFVEEIIRLDAKYYYLKYYRIEVRPILLKQKTVDAFFNLLQKKYYLALDREFQIRNFIPKYAPENNNDST